MPYFENFQEWLQRMHCDSVLLDNKRYHENGAVSDEGCGWWRDPPPEGDLQLEFNRLNYKRGKLQEKESQFRRIKEYISTQSRWHQMSIQCPPADPRAFDDLANLRDEIVKLREEIREAEAKLPSTTGGQDAYARLVDEQFQRGQDDAMRAASFSI